MEERTKALSEREEQLIRSSRLASMGQLAASVAHELNNPLAGILIYLKLTRKQLMRDTLSAERKAELAGYLKTMEMETERCGRLVSSMLQLGRQPGLRISANDLGAIIAKSLVLLEYRFSLRNVKVVVKTDPALPLVLCDAEQLQQTIMGLSLNAYEAMPNGGALTIEAQPCGNSRFVEIRITDTGVGIPPENLPRLFDAFFTTKGEGKGMGLGLSIAHAIVQRHDGTIHVESEVGRGTTFSITLPVKRAPAPADKGAPAAVRE